MPLLYNPITLTLAEIIAFPAASLGTLQPCLETTSSTLNSTLHLLEHSFALETTSSTLNSTLHLLEHSSTSKEPFFLVDLNIVANQYALFHSLLPRVVPYFAIKCNPDHNVISLLNKLGCGFDCASKGELETVLNLGADPFKVIYANPCKQASHIQFAKQSNIQKMTFDNLDELIKIKTIFPDAKCVLRILADDSKSVCQFGIKFGCNIDHVEEILTCAKQLDVDVIGISFHVGSGCFDVSAFADAVILARRYFSFNPVLSTLLKKSVSLFHYWILVAGFQEVQEQP